MSHDLLPHGIHNEDSEIRCHVSPLTREVFIFKTSSARRLVNTGLYRKATATQPGVEGVTAEGYLIPWRDIPGVMACTARAPEVWEQCSPEASTSEKGRLAVAIVLAMMQQGRFPLPVDAYESKDRNVQVAGTDIVVRGQWKVQVKCDYKAGETGNLFIQVAERNPLKLV